MDLPISDWMRTRWIGWWRSVSGAVSGTQGADAPAATEALPLCLSPSDAHRRAALAAPRALAWRRAGLPDHQEWQAKARSKLTDISGFGRFGGPPAVLGRCDEAPGDGFSRQRCYLRVRDGHDVPVHLLIPEDSRSARTATAVICLQGEGAGMHVSWGETHTPEDARTVENGFDLARRAVRCGFLAVCMERPGLGERREAQLYRGGEAGRLDAASRALVLGRCPLGETASDIVTVVNWLLEGEVGAPDQPTGVAVAGYGGGGAAAVLAAALDTRIRAVMAVDCLGNMREAVGRPALDLAFVIPGLLRWMDVEDVVGLCAPRPFLTVAHRRQTRWPIEQTLQVMEGARAVYEGLGAAPALRLVVAESHGSEEWAGAWSRFADMITGPEQPPSETAVDGAESQPS